MVGLGKPIHRRPRFLICDMRVNLHRLGTLSHPTPQDRFRDIIDQGIGDETVAERMQVPRQSQPLQHPLEVFKEPPFRYLTPRLRIAGTRYGREDPTPTP